MKKRLRPIEFLVEKAIAAISFASLACIVLIFIFVFREAAPIFRGETASQKSSVVREHQDSAVGESESYGDPTPVPAAAETPENDPGPSESYGDPVDTTKDTSRASAPTVSVKPPPPPAAPEGPRKAEGVALRRLTSTIWQPVSSDPKFGILPLVVGSLKTALIAILIAGPMGILSALFTSTFAPRWAKELMKPVIEILAGIPSVVIGFFALVILATLLQNIFGFEYRLNAFLGGLAMSIAVIPIIYTLSEDALAAVPKSYTEASLAMGATFWETNFKVVLPAAVPGIFAAVLLGVGRAFGETMIVLMATGNAANLSLRIFEPVRTVSASIGAEMAEVVFGEAHYTVLFFLGAILFAFSFTLNAVAEIFVRDRLMKKFGGAS